jgi:hypothetical protein
MEDSLSIRGRIGLEVETLELLFNPTIGKVV